MCAQYQTVAGSNRLPQSKINENLMKCHLHIAMALVLLGEAIFLEFPTPPQVQGGSAQGKLSCSMKLKEELWVFSGEDGHKGQTTLLIQLAVHVSHMELFLAQKSRRFGGAQAL